MTTRATVGFVGDKVCSRERIRLHGRYEGVDVPAGTELEIVGFEEIVHGRLSATGRRPGVYGNATYPIVRHDGREFPVYASLLSPSDGRPMREYGPESFWLRELPETAFWEGDVLAHPEEGLVKVRSIDWHSFDREPDAGGSGPVYECDLTPGSYSRFRESGLSLHRRGNAWRHAHGEKPVFASLDEATAFHVEVGPVEDVAAPDGRYAFSPVDALAALEDGRADGARHGPSSLVRDVDVEGRNLMLVRFSDREVGEAIRLASIETLELAISRHQRRGY